MAAVVGSYVQPLRPLFRRRVKRSKFLHGHETQASSLEATRRRALDQEYSTVNFADWLDDAATLLGASLPGCHLLTIPPIQSRRGSPDAERVLQLLLHRFESSTEHGVILDR